MHIKYLNRYRLRILAEDHTEACNIVLLDKPIRRMVGTTVPKLMAGLSKNEGKCNDFPDSIKNIIGKEYTLNIILIKENILKDISICYASDVCDFKCTSEVSNSNFTSMNLSEVIYSQEKLYFLKIII